MIGVIAVDDTLKKSVVFRDVLFLRKTFAAEKQEVGRADSVGGAVSATEEESEVERDGIKVRTGGVELVSFAGGSDCGRGSSCLSISGFSSSSSGSGKSNLASDNG